MDSTIDTIQVLLSEDHSLRPRSANEMLYLETILSHIGTVRRYHDADLQASIKRIVPWEDMVINSVLKRSQLDSENVAESECGSKDLLLIELLSWFKNSFFKWFNNGYCDNCAKEMPSVPHTQPTADELRFGASRVELYKCSTCDNTCRFPRYNHPVKLLETRKGRCGEWANCFAAILHTLQYDVRLVVDCADHVWVEAYSDTQKRWIHCDPCEDAVDKPLLYEQGWKKTVTYCIAVNSHEVQDVTWRYTAKFPEVLRRRSSQARESWINSIVLKVTEVLQRNLPSDVKLKNSARRLSELTEFLWCPGQQKEAKASELQGRQSGSLLWRIQRQEIGSVAPTSVVVDYEICLDDQVRKVTYNCAKDEYLVGNEIHKGWASCVKDHSNVFRKEEHDWKMCYLARCEDSLSDASITWSISLNSKSWSAISIKLDSKVYEDGQVEIFVDSPAKIDLLPDVRNTIKREQLPPECAKIEVKVRLSGGTSWQHAQLFRQPLVSGSDQDTFEVILE